MCKGTSTLATSASAASNNGSSNNNSNEIMLEKDNMWMKKVNLHSFRDDIRKLGERLYNEQGPLDVEHLHKMILWGNSVTALGVLLSGIVPVYYLVPAVLLCFGNSCRWLMIAHHTCHGGYDNCDKSKRFNRFRFAVGTFYRRFMDWFDWILPEAWNMEHNNLHHYHLNEMKYDPDFVPRNSKKITFAPVPLFAKYVSALLFAVTWKWAYYAPNTFKELKTIQKRKTHPKLVAKYVDESKGPPTIYDVLEETFIHGKPFPPFISMLDFLLHVLGPYFVWRFMMVPLPWFAFAYAHQYYYAKSEGTGTNQDQCYQYAMQVYINSFLTLLLGDLLANIHSYMIVVPNHAGCDLYWFTSHCKPKSGQFYLRQVIGSVNYWTDNSDIVDFCYAFLNYQIEHHLYPNLSMRSYQIAQPLVKAICKHHGVPYIQENVFLRLKKTVDVVVGNTTMKQFPEGIFPLNDDVNINDSNMDKDEITSTTTTK